MTTPTADTNSNLIKTGQQFTGFKTGQHMAGFPSIHTVSSLALNDTLKSLTPKLDIIPKVNKPCNFKGILY